MKIILSQISNTVHNFSGSFGILKTKPYPADSFDMTAKLSPKKSFWQRLCQNLGFRNKLNPKSFSDGLHTSKEPYYASRESVALSNEYLKTNALLENEKIIDGFRDGGHSAKFDNFGSILSGKREVITIDRRLDTYLSNAIEYAKTSTAGMPEDKRVKFVYNLVHDISGDFKKGDRRAEELGKLGRCKEVLLGKVFEKECATCRHKALMFKILAEECRIKTRMLRGLAFDLGGYGGHVWNEVKLSGGRKFLVDVQNSKIIDISTPQALKNKQLAGYANQKGKRVYY